MVMNNKHGWTSIIEVFVSILLIAGIMAVVINSNAFQKPKISEQIYKEQAQILKVIQMEDGLREKVINEPPTLKESEIEYMIPNYLDCKIKICVLNSECNLNPEAIPDKEIYAKSILITTNKIEYKAKELKLFCWEKGL